MDFVERVAEYDSLPEQNRLEAYRKLLRETESKLLDLAGDPLKYEFWTERGGEEVKYQVRELAGDRAYVLNKMFALHCSEAEVARMEQLNSYLLDITNRMYARTAEMFRYMMQMPRNPQDDIVEVEGKLTFWSDTDEAVLKLEEDDFYGSDFLRMIPIADGAEYDLPIRSCVVYCNSDAAGKSDKELGMVNELDDGETWAEGWLYNPKLDHIVMCHAIHDLATHRAFSVPDVLRLNDFQIVIDTQIRLRTK